MSRPRRCWPRPGSSRSARARSLVSRAPGISAPWCRLTLISDNPAHRMWVGASTGPGSVGMWAGRPFVMHEMRSRALGALYGLAIGDALGMPTQSLSRAEVVAGYGPLVGEFCPGPDGHPLAAGLPAGSVTDDTEQAMLLARLVVAGGGDVDAADLARGLLGWEESMRARGSLDLLGPSTRQALAALAAGAGVAEAGRGGLTNGAAMRITPVGIATGSRDPGLLEDRVVAASQMDHN